MKFKIIGSGGCVSLPRPVCKCKVCKQAREKGKPYSRFGCCLYLEDISLIVDTPEDIAHSLNYFNVDSVENVLYSHMDPDHTLGMRVFEQLKLNWLDVSIGKENNNPISVYARGEVMEDLHLIKSKYGPYLDYYENIRNLIKRKVVEDSITISNIKITFIKANESTVFVFEEGFKKVIFAPCDVKPFPKDDIFYDADVLIIGNTIIGDVLKNGFILEEDNIFRKELFTMDEIVDLKNKYNINKVVVTHIEEDWGKSYDDYIVLEKDYDNVYFAYDGMEIII